MAANFWTSTHCQRWLLTKETLASRRSGAPPAPGEPSGGDPPAESSFVRGVVVELLQSLGAKLRFHPRIVATACVFFQRFYATAGTSVAAQDPLVVAPTCLYLATKVEEMGQPSPDAIFDRLRTLLEEPHAHVQLTARAAAPVASSGGKDPDLAKLKARAVTAAEIFACEEVLAHLVLDLVVFHPHTDLRRFLDDCGLAANADVADTALSILNDVQGSDVVLVYPPFIVALAVLHAAAVAHNADVTVWMDELNVDHARVRACVEDVVAFYQMMQDKDLKRRAVDWFVSARAKAGVYPSAQAQAQGPLSSSGVAASSVGVQPTARA